MCGLGKTQLRMGVELAIKRHAHSTVVLAKQRKCSIIEVWLFEISNPIDQFIRMITLIDLSVAPMRYDGVSRRSGLEKRSSIIRGSSNSRY